MTFALFCLSVSTCFVAWATYIAVYRLKSIPATIVAAAFLGVNLSLIYMAGKVML